MHTVRVEHTIDCTPARYWELYLNESFTRELLTKGLGFSDPEITEPHEDEFEKCRNMKVEPQLELPPRIQKFMKNKMSYFEKGRFDKKNKRFYLEHTTAALGSKLHLSGECFLEALDDNRCRREALIRVDVRIFAIGSLIEKAIERNIHKGWDNSATFINGWLAEHPA